MFIISYIRYFTGKNKYFVGICELDVFYIDYELLIHIEV